MTDGPDPRRLERDTSNRMIAGVASGVANYFNLDPTIVRVLWVAAVLFGGFGVGRRGVAARASPAQRARSVPKIRGPSLAFVRR